MLLMLIKADCTSCWQSPREPGVCTQHAWHGGGQVANQCWEKTRTAHGCTLDSGAARCPSVPSNGNERHE